MFRTKILALKVQNVTFCTLSYIISRTPSLRCYRSANNNVVKLCTFWYFSQLESTNFPNVRLISTKSYDMENKNIESFNIFKICNCVSFGTFRTSNFPYFTFSWSSKVRIFQIIDYFIQQFRHGK